MQVVFHCHCISYRTGGLEGQEEAVTRYTSTECDHFALCAPGRALCSCITLCGLLHLSAGSEDCFHCYGLTASGKLLLTSAGC